jgi:hypothetical protein
METGNGQTKFSVGTADMGGWIRVFLEKGTPPADLPVFLSQTLTEWFRKRPGLRIKCVAPVMKDGDTVELHAWYEAHVFDPSPIAPHGKPEGKSTP